MKKLIAVAVCSAALCASTVFAEIIVPDNPVNLVAGRSFATDQKFQSSVAPSDTASKLFDGDTTTRWLADTPNAAKLIVPEAFIHFDQGLVINAYRIFPSDKVKRAPKSWTFYGSNDRQNWTLLDTREGVSGWTYGTGQVFSFDNIQPYSSYRFVCTVNCGETYLSINEFELFEFAVSDLLSIRSNAGQVGEPTPAYGGVPGLKDGDTVRLDMAQTQIVDAETGLHYQLTGGRLSNYAGEELRFTTPDELPYVWSYAGSFALWTWVWQDEFKDLCAVSHTDITVPSNGDKNEITTSNTNSSGSPANLFNDEKPPYAASKVSRWYVATSANPTPWVQYRFKDRRRLVTGLWMHPTINTGRLPTFFEVMGSNDGENFEVLAQFEPDGKKLPRITATEHYDFDNATPYEWYRVRMSGGNGAHELGQMEFYSFYSNDCLRVKGEPASYGQPVPGYGFTYELQDCQQVALVAPEGTIQVSDDERVACVGYSIQSTDATADTGLVRELSGTYFHSAGQQAVVKWHFGSQYRQRFAVVGGGEVSTAVEWTENGQQVTVVATPGSNGAPFTTWSGDLPDGVDPTNPELSYFADGPRFVTANFAAPVHVSPTGSDGNDGYDWNHALATPMAACERTVDGSVVYIAPGEYVISGGVWRITRAAAFVASGDPSETVFTVDGEAPGFAVSIENAGATLSGVTVCNGSAADGQAGGIRVLGGVVSNCVVSSCASTASGSSGGGVYMADGTTLVDTLVTNCTANGIGGGVCCQGGRIDGCVLVANTATSTGGGAYLIGVEGGDSVLMTNTVVRGNKSSGGSAGGIYEGTQVRVADCVVSGNKASASGCYGGGCYIDHGASLIKSFVVSNSSSRSGGVFMDYGTVSRCEIRDNSASSHGGGLCIESYGTIDNTLIVGNSCSSGSTTDGGGVFAREAGGQVSRLMNCTITGNRGAYAGGVLYNGSALTVNCIIYGNSLSRAGAEPVQVTGSTGEISYSCIGDAAFTNRATCIVADPLFADAENGDYTLEYKSPCVNAGSNSSVGSGETDLVGNPRIHRFGGRAKYDVVDMGCYESPWRHMNGLQILVR